MPRKSPFLRSFPARAAALAALLALSAGFAAAAGPKIPTAPDWVFRGQLAGNPSPMIFLALNGGMTVAYDEPAGSLFLALKGRVVPLGHGETEGPPGAAGPALPPAAPPSGSAARGAGAGKAPVLYRPEGLELHRRLAPSPWSVRGPKGPLPVTVTYVGASARGDLAVLAWTLRLPGGRRISVEEVPRFDDHYGDWGLFRTFSVKGLPAGDTLRLDLTGKGMAETWGGGGDGGVEERDGRRFLVQAVDGETPLKVTWSAPAAPGR